MPKVLVIDDSLSVRKVVERALQARSIEVVSAASGTEALERIERERPDIVVCDVILPDREGYEICQFVRECPGLEQTPVLLISGIVNSTVLARAAEVQSSDVMFKPFTADELASKIGDLLASQGLVAGNGAAPSSAAPPPRPTSAPAAAAPPTTWPPTAPATPTRPPAPASAVSQPAASARPAAPRPASPAPPAPSEPATPRLESLNTRLAGFTDIPGVRFAALVDREGFLIESVGEMALEADVAGALASCLADSSEGIGRDLDQGALLGMMLEYEGGMLLLYAVATSALLVVVIRDPAALGKVRYYVKKALPELVQAI